MTFDLAAAKRLRPHVTAFRGALRASDCRALFNRVLELYEEATARAKAATMPGRRTSCR